MRSSAPPADQHASLSALKVRGLSRRSSSNSSCQAWNSSTWTMPNSRRPLPPPLDRSLYRSPNCTPLSTHRRAPDDFEFDLMISEKINDFRGHSFYLFSRLHRRWCLGSRGACTARKSSPAPPTSSVRRRASARRRFGRPPRAETIQG